VRERGGGREWDIDRNWGWGRDRGRGMRVKRRMRCVKDRMQVCMRMMRRVAVAVPELIVLGIKEVHQQNSNVVAWPALRGASNQLPDRMFSSILLDRSQQDAYQLDLFLKGIPHPVARHQQPVALQVPGL
jgi:hypothetical protein